MSRIDVLRAKMHAEESSAAAKPRAVKVKAPKVKSVKVTKPALVAPPAEAVVFDPKPTLMECIQKLTSEEASSPKNVVATVMLFIADELLRCPRPTMSTLSDNMLANYVFICEQVWADKPDIKRVLSCAVGIVDGIECRSGSGGEGDAITRLHQLEQALVRRKMGAR